MRTLQVTIGVIVATTIAAILASLFLIPTPSAWPASSEPFQVSLAVTSAIALPFTGTVLLFLMGLSVYKKELRLAYIAICAGITLNALGTLELPLMTLGRLPAFISDTGLSVVPFVFSGLVMYIGVRKIGRLIGLKSLLIKVTIVIPAALAICILVIFLPHGAINQKETYYDASNAISTWVTLFDALNGWLALTLRNRMGAHYTRAMTWLAQAFLVGAMVTFAGLVHGFLGYSANDWAIVAIEVVGAIVGVFYVAAGYTFARTKEL